jgi:endonuclease YncB( thermonuclease family)
MKFKRALKISIYIVFSILLTFESISFADQFKVIAVYDGDTLKAESQGYEITVRLVGIDAPETSKKKNEPGQPFSQKAKIHLQKLVLNKTVEIEGYGLDRYSHVLGVVYVDNINVNMEMVKEGLAEVYKGKPAHGFNNQPYWNAEREARENMDGMWSQGDKYISPKDWRRQQKE